MKSIFILYMPGHAGNFLTRLFSLGSETIPHLSKQTLSKSLIGRKLEQFDRLDAYSFEESANYTNWQKFHRGFVDFYDSDDIEMLNHVCQDRYPNVVYSTHPDEFIKFSDKITAKDMDLYHVELDSKYNEWVEESQKELKFVTRPNEDQNFLKIISEHNSKSISLTKMLESKDAFLDEYVRVCKLMNLTPVQNQAVKLYENWRSIRVDKSFLFNKLTVKVQSMPPNDDFTFPLFTSLVNPTLPQAQDCEAYYVWGTPPEEFTNFLNNLIPTKPNVIIGIKDLLDLWGDFNWWVDSIQAGSKAVISLANKFPKTNFIIFTSLEHLDQEVDVSNVQLVSWGGDLTNQSSVYPTIDPVLDKNFNSNTTFISLNRQARQHRLVLLSYLFGAGYNVLGDISFLNQVEQVEYEQDDLLDRLPWMFDEERHEVIREKILSGYKQIYNNKQLIIDDYKIYSTIGQNNNFDNFNAKLRPRYKNSFVEIVSESSFSAPSFMLTEKTLNSIYACNFPIILAGVGAVAHLREIGFDMFDDVIDHSYDLIANPFDRITTAIDKNRRLLIDADHVKQLWKINQDRFENNVKIAKTGMYEWYRNRTIAQFDNINWA